MAQACRCSCSRAGTAAARPAQAAWAHAAAARRRDPHRAAPWAAGGGVHAPQRADRRPPSRRGTRVPLLLARAPSRRDRAGSRPRATTRRHRGQPALATRATDHRRAREDRLRHGQASSDQGLGWLAKVNRAWQRLHGDDAPKIVAGLVDPASQDACAEPFVEKDAHRVCSIDEPELHLHPEWQAGILPALRELAPRAQFRVATHVDAPWNRAHSWERALLSAPRPAPTARAPCSRR